MSGPRTPVPVDLQYIEDNLEDFEQYARYIGSRLPVALQARKQNTAEITRLLAARDRVRKHLKTYQTSLTEPDPEVQQYIEELRRTRTKPVKNKVYKFNQERKIVTAATPEALQQEIIKEAKAFLGQNSGPAAELRSGKAMLGKAALTDTFLDKDNTAAVDLVVAGEYRLINVLRKRDNAYVYEFYNLEHFGSPGIGAMFDRFKSADTSTFKWAIMTVENFLINSPFPNDTIVIMGNMPHKCVEALIIYCLYKGYPYVNQSAANVKVSDRKLKAFTEKMNTQYQSLVGVHAALAYAKDAPEELENISQGLKV